MLDPPDDLPPGWKQRVSKSDPGKIYYYHAGPPERSQWNHPGSDGGSAVGNLSPRGAATGLRQDSLCEGNGTATENLGQAPGSSRNTSGFVSGGHLATGEHWRTCANQPAQGETKNSKSASLTRHPGTPLGGERPARRGPRSTPRRVWTRRSESDDGPSSNPIAPASPDIAMVSPLPVYPQCSTIGLAAIPPLPGHSAQSADASGPIDSGAGNDTSMAEEIAAPLPGQSSSTDGISSSLPEATTAPMPDSQESIFSFGFPAASGSQDSDLANRAQRCLRMASEPQPVDISGFAGSQHPVGAVAAAGSQDSDLAVRAQRSLALDADPPSERQGETVAPRAPSTIPSPPSRRQRLNESGSSVGRGANPRRVSQDGRRRRERANNQTAAPIFLRCAQCGPAPGAFQAREARGLMQHLCRAHLGQELSAEAVAQLRALDRVACQVCASIRVRTNPTCGRCGVATPTRALILGDVIPDTRIGQQAPPAAVSPAGQRADAAGGPQAQAQSEARDEDDLGPGTVRRVALSEQSKGTLPSLHSASPLPVPRAVASRFATAWAESLEGGLGGDATWALLCCYRTRLLLSNVPVGTDRNEELKRRLRFWERGEMDALITHIIGQQLRLDAASKRDRSRDAGMDGDDEKLGKRARVQVAVGLRSKAMKGLVGGIAEGDTEEKRVWAESLIPRSAEPALAPADDAERDASRSLAWGQGDARAAKAAMREVGRQKTGLASLPHVKIAPMSAPGPSGDRQEHLDSIVDFAGAGQRRKLFRALDQLTVRWAIDDLPDCCRWLLNTQVFFLRKDRDLKCKFFNDEDWTALDNVTNQGATGPLDDVPEAAVSADMGDATGLASTAGSQAPKVRPIQMGEFLRKYVSRRLLALSDKSIAKLMAATRQLGNGIPGGAEALGIFHQLVYDEWAAGTLTVPLARIKVDEKNCFGMIEWRAIRAAAREMLPRHAAVAAWKHASASFVEQKGVEPVEKNRGAEQGDVDGPLECSMAMAQVARDARTSVAELQRSGALPWVTESGISSDTARDDFDARSARARVFETESTPDASVRIDPRHEVQVGGGVADFWYLDDGDILCHPSLVLSYIDAFDVANEKIGAVRNRSKTEVLYYATPETLGRNTVQWQVEQVRTKATVQLAAEGTNTLGVATGPAHFVTAQLETKTAVVKAMHERVQLCQDSQSEFILARESLGVGRVNHILRVHGHHLAENGGATNKFDDVGRRSLERLFPGLTSEGYEQASLGARESGLGWRLAQDVARPAHLGALVAASPRVKDMVRACASAGLLPADLLETRLDSLIATAEASYYSVLDEVEKVKAEEFLRRAKAAAEEMWQRTLTGASGPDPPAPMVAHDGPGDDEDDPMVVIRRRGKLNGPQLQRELSILADATKIRRLIATLQGQGAWSQLDRITELRHKEVTHKWLYHCDTKSGGVLTSIDFVANVQKRLGCRSYTGQALCRLCGRQLDAHLEHSETCSTAEATRGHYACVRAVVEGLKLADPAVTTEPRGLTSTTSRPADIFTTAAVPGRGAALDVCVASPNAAAAMGDAAEAAFRRKLRRYRREIQELSAAGIAFRPLVWTADGRPHPAAIRTLRFAADIAVTRNGQQATAGMLVSRWKHEIQIAILRRRATMTRAVLPRATTQQLWLMEGRADREGGNDSRMAPLDEDGEATECPTESGSSSEACTDDSEGDDSGEGDTDMQ